MSMQILAIDDEQPALNRLNKAISEAVPDCHLYSFEDPQEALEYIIKNNISPNIAFLDIEMYNLTGIEVAKQIKDVSSYTKIIFVTAYSKYALEAYSLHARGYLLKPVTPAKIIEEISNFNESTIKSRIQIHTFGNFDIFVDNQPVYFHRSKSKEILAYLVDRQGTCATKKEIAAVLWEDKEYTRYNQIYLQTLITELIKSLEAVNAQCVVRKNRNSYSVDPLQFDCDFYSFLKYNIDAINSYHGEYMSNYSWAEFTTGFLDEQKNNK